MTIFRTLSAKTAYTSRAVTVVEEQIVLPNNAEKTFVIVDHPGAVVIVPIESDGCLYLLRQYRHSIKREILEFPAGTLGRNEAPRACAERELAEEVGKQAARWRELGVLYPAPGFCNEIQHIFVAEGLTDTFAEKDDDEVIEVQLYSMKQLDELAAAGEITDGKTLAVMYRMRAMGIVD